MATTPSILQSMDTLTGPPQPPGRRGNGSGNGNGDASGPSSPSHLAILGIWVALAPILMLFLAFVSAYVVRQGLGSNWSAIPVPKLLWGNTLVLLISSVLLERARHLVRGGDAARGWFLATLLCGVVFVVGQGIAWNQLAARGIGISSSAHSSFFYLLTGTHAVHLAGGIAALAAATFWPPIRYGMSREVVSRVTSIYWHFMGILWVGLFLVLSFWR